jgi:hypothetical protein
MQTLLSTWQAYRTDGQPDRVNRYINRMLVETGNGSIWLAARNAWEAYARSGDAAAFETFLTENRFFMESFFPMGSTKVWYYRPECGRDAHFADFGSMIDPENLGKTHILLCQANFFTTEQIFIRLQDWPGDRFKETNDYLDSIGLAHTSMSIGDIAEIDGKLYLCVSHGWTTL